MSIKRELAELRAEVQRLRRELERAQAKIALMDTRTIPVAPPTLVPVYISAPAYQPAPSVPSPFDPYRPLQVWCGP